MNIKFNPADASQKDEVEAILRSAFTTYASKVGYALTQNTFSWLTSAISNRAVYVGMHDHRMIGVVVTRLHGVELELKFIAVPPQFHGRGIGGRLIALIEQQALSLGCTVLTLHTALLRDDLIRFYKHHGFVEFKRAPPEHGKDNNIRIHMKKLLSP